MERHGITYLRVSIRDMASFLALAQSTDYISQAAQTFVDVLRLLHSIALRTRLLKSL